SNAKSGSGHPPATTRTNSIRSPSANFVCGHSWRCRARPLCSIKMLGGESSKHSTNSAIVCAPRVSAFSPLSKIVIRLDSAVIRLRRATARQVDRRYRRNRHGPEMTWSQSFQTGSRPRPRKRFAISAGERSSLISNWPVASRSSPFWNSGATILPRTVRCKSFAP
ncbi:MAG: hypothetical protein QOI96_537, partial [Verrucomicrobiota bacterium]